MHTVKAGLCHGRVSQNTDTGVSENGGTPKSSILIVFSIINHPFWGTIILGNPRTPKLKNNELDDSKAPSTWATQNKSNALPLFAEKNWACFVAHDDGWSIFFEGTILVVPRLFFD